MFFQRTQVQLLEPTWWLITISNSRVRGSDAFWPLWAPGMHMVHRHTCKQNTHKQNKIIKKLSLNLDVIFSVKKWKKRKQQDIYIFG